jgi:hypothetical protein
MSGSTRRAVDDLHPATCSGASGSLLSAEGADVAYRVEVGPGQTLEAVLTPVDFDGALYLLDACDAAACADGADASFVAGGTETVRRTNTTSAPVEWLVVVDAWRAGVGGTFELALSRQ